MLINKKKIEKLVEVERGEDIHSRGGEEKRREKKELMREGEREEKEIEGCWCIFAQRKREEEEEEDESHPVCYDMTDYSLLICGFFYRWFY